MKRSIDNFKKKVYVNIQVTKDSQVDHRTKCISGISSELSGLSDDRLKTFYCQLLEDRNFPTFSFVVYDM